MSHLAAILQPGHVLDVEEVEQLAAKLLPASARRARRLDARDTAIAAAIAELHPPTFLTAAAVELSAQLRRYLAAINLNSDDRGPIGHACKRTFGGRAR